MPTGVEKVWQLCAGGGHWSAQWLRSGSEGKQYDSIYLQADNPASPQPTQEEGPRMLSLDHFSRIPGGCFCLAKRPAGSGTTFSCK